MQTRATPDGVGASKLSIESKMKIRGERDNNAPGGGGHRRATEELVGWIALGFLSLFDRARKRLNPDKSCAEGGEKREDNFFQHLRSIDFSDSGSLFRQIRTNSARRLGGYGFGKKLNPASKLVSFPAIPGL